jgi:predicted nucleotidyltransferase
MVAREGARMKLSIQEQKVLSEVVRTLRTRFGAVEVILYGSAARGDLDEESDIDLLVVLPKLDWTRQKEIIGVCFDAELQCGRVISAICYTTDEIEHTPLRSSPLVMTARREGQSLYE